MILMSRDKFPILKSAIHDISWIGKIEIRVFLLLEKLQGDQYAGFETVSLSSTRTTPPVKSMYIRTV